METQEPVIDKSELYPKEFTERIHMKATVDPTEENGYEGQIEVKIISYDDKENE